jgi:ankyrin repeat protein
MYVGRFTDRFDNQYADVNYVERMTRPYNSLLMQASNSLNIQLIFALVEKGADVNLCSPSGSHSPISRAIQSRVFCSDLLRRTLKHETETIRCLVDLGANIYYVEPKYNWNYLFYAIYYKNWQLIPLLLKYGINPNHQDNSLKNPLCYALSRSNMCPDRAKSAVIAPKEAVVALMGAGSDPFATDSNGQSSFDYAKQYPGYPAILNKYRKGDKAWYAQQQVEMAVSKKGSRISFT